MKKTGSHNIKPDLKHYWHPLLLMLLVVIGIILSTMDVFDWRQVLKWAENYTQYWWTALLLILVQAVLYTFALPGSLMLWVVAPLYPPLTATIMLVTGTTLGAISAYLFARHETLTWTARVHENHLFHLLEKRGDFLSLLALRIMPSSPHSVINYGAGILHLPLRIFVLSTLISITLKNILYTNAIHNAVAAADPSELMRFKIIAPLIFLALLFTTAELLRAHWARGQQQKRHHKD